MSIAHTIEANARNGNSNPCQSPVKNPARPESCICLGNPGSELWRDDNETQHRLTISRSFWMGRYEVTQAQWEAVMGSNPSYFKGSGRPVEQVSWNDPQVFIRKLNAKGQGQFRLPTEAEWEFTCRAGSTSAYCFGGSASRLGGYAWYDENSGNKTRWLRVGSQAGAWIETVVVNWPM